MLLLVLWLLMLLIPTQEKRASRLIQILQSRILVHNSFVNFESPFLFPEVLLQVDYI